MRIIIEDYKGNDLCSIELDAVMKASTNLGEDWSDIVISKILNCEISSTDTDKDEVRIQLSNEDWLPY